MHFNCGFLLLLLRYNNMMYLLTAASVSGVVWGRLRLERLSFIEAYSLEKATAHNFYLVSFFRGAIKYGCQDVVSRKLQFQGIYPQWKKSQTKPTRSRMCANNNELNSASNSLRNQGSRTTYYIYLCIALHTYSLPELP